MKEGNGQRGKPLVLVSFWQLLLSSVSSLLPSEIKTGDCYIYITVKYINITASIRVAEVPGTSLRSSEDSLTFFFSSRSFINVSLSTSLTTVGRPATQPPTHPRWLAPPNFTRQIFSPVTFMILQSDPQLG